MSGICQKSTDDLEKALNFRKAQAELCDFMISLCDKYGFSATESIRLMHDTLGIAIDQVTKR